ncbi:MAG: site-2 protease family protein [Dehalococcoidia bacterium]|jgi:Zn-dependent protease/CBS domain-containing protein|nr:site-2 protease family protein [Dehalococcoidia bacterium]
MDVSSGLVIGRIRGVEIRVHWSWLIIFWLIAWTLSEGLFPTYQPQWDERSLWVAGVVSSLLFFGSVLFHELSHTFVALHYRMRVPSITLFVFGGVSQIADEMRSPRQEFLISVAGPLSSWLLAVIFGALWAVFQAEPFSVVFGYLGVVNFLLGAFNLLPGFPLDGGRVFRSIMWGRLHDLTRATQIASRVGQGIAWVMIAVGIAFMVFVNWGGLWYVLIGLFLKNASENAYAQLLLERALRDLKVRELMQPAPEPVLETWSLQRVADERVLAQAQRALFVEDMGHVSGLITVADLSKVPRAQWETTTVRAAMVPAERVITVTSEVSALEAMRLMQEHDVHQVPVIDDGTLVGLLTRGDVLRRLELNALVGNFEPEAGDEATRE